MTDSTCAECDAKATVTEKDEVKSEVTLNVRTANSMPLPDLSLKLLACDSTIGGDEEHMIDLQVKQVESAPNVSSRLFRGSIDLGNNKAMAAIPLLVRLLVVSPGSGKQIETERRLEVDILSQVWRGAVCASLLSLEPPSNVLNCRALSTMCSFFSFPFSLSKRPLSLSLSSVCYGC